jgi:asparagine synthase (glutamine-hydrolysing)
MKNYLPEDIVYRRKKGFGIPLSYWLRNDLKYLMNDLFSLSELAKHKLFNAVYVERLKEEHLSRKYNHRKLLWTLMVFQLWYQKWLN